MHDFMALLNDAQRRCVLHEGGPLLILAGAGSGKTRVITCRIAHLIKEIGVPEDRILAVTFTNKAANEMKSRIENLLGTRPRVLAGTFHSICARILRREASKVGYDPSFAIYDEGNQLALIRESIPSRIREEKTASPRAILSEISRIKNNRIDPETYARQAFGQFQELVSLAYPAYQEKLRLNGAMDFDDLLLQCVSLFSENPSTLNEYRDRFRHILVDEYQDVNSVQYALVRMLAETHRNLCAVGDDDQSIYRFRGADVGIILSFEKDFPETTVVKLEENYRSTKTILDAANHVVSNNEKRKSKTLFTRNSEGNRLVYYQAASPQDEARFAIEEIRKHRNREGRDLSHFVILYRTNAQSRAFEDGCVQEGIPYRVVGGLRFYDRKEIKDVGAYLSLLANPADQLAFRQALEVPSRGVGATSLKKLFDRAALTGVTVYRLVQKGDLDFLGARQRKGLTDFVQLLEELRAKLSVLSLPDLVKAVLDRSGYRPALEAERTVEAQGRLENLEEFVTMAAEFEQESPEEDPLTAFLARLALVSDVDTWQEGFDALTLMTLHSAKGLEFPIVFISGLEEQLFPHSRSLLDPVELEEERRLFYVGITRAREQVILTSSQTRKLYGTTVSSCVSRFLSEIPDHLIETAAGAGSPSSFSGGEGGARSPKNSRSSESRRSSVVVGSGWQGLEVKVAPPPEDECPFVPGDVVSHRIWGSGTVLSVDKDLIVIEFAAGKKMLFWDSLKAPVKEPAPDFGLGKRVVHPEFGTGVVVQVRGAGVSPEVAVAFPGKGIKHIRTDTAGQASNLSMAPPEESAYEVGDKKFL
ncbi:MAG: UvrD-helicase domain-containing protein [Armatimonadetes bacterium]|nr:UvrD-helicase domain-containing protein [Armatimonadota bacterium]